MDKVIKAEGGDMRRSWSATLTWVGVFAIALGLGISAQTADHDFVSQAAMSNMAAIQLGHLASKKAQNADVKKFAQATVDEHLKAQQQLADAAYGAGIRWPKQLDQSLQQIQQRLSKLSDAQFDREFMKTMVDRHRNTEKMLAARTSQGAAKSDGLSLAAKVDLWAAQTLPEVRAHLKEAEQLYAGVARGE